MTGYGNIAKTKVVRELGVPAHFCQISCQILAEKFFQSNKNFPPFFPKHQSNLLLNFSREIFPVKQNLLSLVNGGTSAFSNLLPNLTEKIPSQIFTPF